MIDPVTTECKVCETQVEQQLMYCSPDETSFFYSCGCVSYQNNESGTWITRQGKVFKFNEI